MLPLQEETLACIDVAGFCANGSAALVVPFVERDSDTTVGSLGGAWRTVHIEARTATLARETPHFTLLSDVGHITHTYTQRCSSP